jgi:hypothetical protein
MKTKTTLALSLCVFLFGFAKAQFSASGSQAATVTTSSTAQGTDWTSASNVQTSDNVFATCLITGTNKPTYYLDAKNWGFQTSNNALPNYIPGSATINGIEVFITMKKTGVGKIRDNKIILLKAGSEAGSSKARSSVLWPTTAAETKFGGNIDLWGTTWTASDLIDVGFGVRICAKNRGSKDAQAEIDYIRINIYFNQVFYYSKSTGNLESTGTWGTNTDGTGTAPTNFTTNGQIFFIKNRTTATLTNNLTISGAYSKIVVGDAVSATTLTIPSNYTLTAIVDVANASNLTISNTTVPTIGAISDNTTVTYNAAGNQNVGEATYYNLNLAGSGTKAINSSTGSISVNNVLTIASGVTVDNQAINVFIYGSSVGISNSGVATGLGKYVYSLLDVSTNISGTGTFSNLEVDFSTSTTTKTLTLSNATGITGSLYLTDGTFSNGTNLTMNEGSIFYIADGTLNNTISSLGYDVIYLPFTGTFKTTTNELTGSLRNFDMQITPGTTLNLNRNLVLSGNLSLTSGSLDPTATNYNLTVGGNFTNNATLIQRNIVMTFNGSAAQNLNASSSQSFYDVVINNSANEIILNAPITVTHQLTLTNGFLRSSSANLATLGSSASISGGSTSSFVSGPLQWTVASTSATKTFTIGKGSSYRPVNLTINQISSSSTLYTAEMFNSAPPSRNLPFTLNNVSQVRYYTITSSNNSNLNNATVLINYASDDNVVDASTVRIAKSNGPDWMNIGGVGTANGTGSITSNNFYSFSDFVLANTYTVLPLKWISFTAENKPTGVELKWQTGNEMNVNNYKLERSTDGTNWNEIAAINAANRTNNCYSYVDINSGTRNFYRVKAVDVDRKISISKIILVESGKLQSEISLYPNPVIGKTLNCSINDPEILNVKEVEVKIFDATGSLKYSSTVDPQMLLKINCGQLLPGYYLLMIKAGNVKQQKNFMVE